ncbi:UbiA family prenyltransferase [Microbispora sp. RL4-1S]|uniref:UbiA family prenyltransferase n=1 Tax=Microbispora oryzae TaxID=2806554 RepID=A0A941AMH5_9ACTN|nr:UbiA family prenyltransferase [Microbispora oryzae]
MRDLVDLVRAPAALSVPGDVVAGAAAAGALDRRTAGLASASVCLYWGGMAANDWADRHMDMVERPERPIPSGRISPGGALAVAAGLTVAGVAAAALAGGPRAGVVAGALAATVWAYDTTAKDTVAGPAAMALCRVLDVLLGAAPSRRAAGALPAALVVGAHTYLVTVLSRHEVSGTGPALPAGTLTATLALAASVCRREGRIRNTLAGWYAARFALAQARAAADPSAENIRTAVGTGIVTLPALQGALTAAAGAPAAGLAVAAAAPVGRILAKKVSPT